MFSRLGRFLQKVCQLGQMYNGGIDFPRDLVLEPTQLTLFIAEKHMFLQHLALLAISHSFVKETERWEILGWPFWNPFPFFCPSPPNVYPSQQSQFHICSCWLLMSNSGNSFLASKGGHQYTSTYMGETKTRWRWKMSIDFNRTRIEQTKCLKSKVERLNFLLIWYFAS